MSCFSRAGVLFLAFSALNVPTNSLAQQGVLEVYVDQHRGNPTASGERYEPGALTAAHQLLPMGTLLRVTNSTTGRVVDVRVNDRKSDDGRLVYLSGAAGKHLGIAPGQSAQGRIQVLAPNSIQTANSAVPSSNDIAAQAQEQARLQQQAVTREGQKFGFGLFQKNKSSEPLDAYLQPGTDPVVAQSSSGGQGVFGRLFGNRSNSAGQGAFGIGRKPAYQYPEPEYSPNGQVIPMSSPNPGAVNMPVPGIPQQDAPSPVPPVQAVPSSSLPVGPAAPYRVQFGAYKKAKHAEQMNTGLLQGGISTMVVQSTANQLFLVITQNGFPSASEAQRWVDFEGSRRGWRERPVVIR